MILFLLIRYGTADKGNFNPLYPRHLPALLPRFSITLQVPHTSYVLLYYLAAGRTSVCGNFWWLKDWRPLQHGDSQGSGCCLTRQCDKSNRECRDSQKWWTHRHGASQTSQLHTILMWQRLFSSLGEAPFAAERVALVHTPALDSSFCPGTALKVP